MPRMTADQFLDWDGGGHVGKLELVHGEVRAMSPASPTHAQLQGNLTGLIWAHLRAQKLPCRVAPEAPVQPQIHANDNVRVPDIAVTCAPPGKDKYFPAPVLIIEILSPSNKKDTWNSIYAMATIPALKEIAVVDSETVRVEVFRLLEGGGWPEHGEVTENGGTVQLVSISAAFPIAEIYAGTYLA